MTQEATLNYLRETERETRKFRLLALTVVMILFYLQRGPTTEDMGLVVSLLGLALGYLAYALALATVFLPRVRTPSIVYGLVTVDVLTLGGAFLLAGTVQTALIALVPVLVLYYSVFFGYASALFASSLVSIVYVGLAVFFNLPVTGSLDKVSLDPVIPVQVMSFFFLSLLSGYLGRKRIVERKEREELQEVLRVQNRARGLLEVANALSSSQALDEILEGLVKDSPQIVGASDAVVALLDEEKNELQLQVATLDPGVLKAQRLSDVRFPPDDGSATAQAMASGQPVVLSDVQPGDPRLPAWARPVLGVCALMVVPLSARDKRLGLVYLIDTANPSRSFDERVVALTTGYCSLAANTIANALIHRAAEGRVSKLLGELQTTIHRMDRLRETRKQPTLTVGGLHIDTVNNRATLDGQLLRLSPTEFDVLYLLAENAGRPLNADTMLWRVWGEEHTGQTNAVDVCIHRLRRKMGKGGKSIHTVRGVGYMLDMGSSETPARELDAAPVNGGGR